MHNQELVKYVETLVKVERRISVKILRHLIEIEKRRIHLDMGYASLFVFLTKHLKYSEGSAYRRIEAMKLLRDVPDLGNKIAVGSISVTVAAEVSRLVKIKKIKNKETKQKLINLFSNKNKKEVEEEIAKIAPKAAKKEKLISINSEESHLEVTVSKELRKKLEKLKALLSHKNPSLKMSGVLEVMADIALKQLEKRTSPEIARASNNPKKSRYIPAKTKRIIFQRAKHQCEFTAQDKRCESKHFLEIDHKHSYSHGGGNETQNLQLLCRQHNQRKAEIEHGRQI